MQSMVESGPFGCVYAAKKLGVIPSFTAVSVGSHQYGRGVPGA
jgi:hypothetical protein